MKKSETTSNKPSSKALFKMQDYEKTGIPQDEIEELKEAFDLFDIDSTGSIDPKQLLEIMTTSGLQSKGHSLYHLITDYAQKKQQITFAMFLDVMTVKAYSPNTRQNMKKVFRYFDDEKVSCLSSKNLKRVFMEAGIEVDDNELQELIDKADLDNDGLVSEEEFYQIMTKVSSKL